MAHTVEPLTIDGPSSGKGLMDDGGDYAIKAGGWIIGEAIHRTGVDHYEDALANAMLWSTASELLDELESAEQTLRNLANGFLTGDAKEIAQNQALRILTLIAKARGECGNA